MSNITVTLQSGDEYTVGSITTSSPVTVTTSSGIQGPQGSQGTTGAQGAQGTAGAQGSQGSVGAQGSQGVSGSQGPQGDVGAQGTAGAQGSQGDTGAQGPQGAAGAQGSQGVQGTQGTQGDVGTQGPQGVQGPQGSQGLAGAQGSQGVVGPQGPQGDTGLQGASVVSANVATGNLVITLSNTAVIDTGTVLNPNVSANKIQETFVSLSNANGTFTHDCSNTQVFNHTSIASNFTANFTNLNLANNYATSLTLILNQGATPYVANAVQISGAGQTVNWQGNTAAPAGNANKKDIISFSIINNSGTYTVFGQLTSFG